MKPLYLAKWQTMTSDYTLLYLKLMHSKIGHKHVHRVVNCTEQLTVN